MQNKKKIKYRIKNWSKYNEALKQRGNLTIWFDKDIINSWYNPKKTGKKGRPILYSDLAIQCCLTLKMIYHLPLRATQGLVLSLLKLLQIPLSAPDYSLLSIRQKNLTLVLSRKFDYKNGMHLVVDSTGLKLYGEGEWKVRKHGADKRRTWLKVHLGINEASHDIKAVVLTTNDVHDSEALPMIVEQITDKVDQITGDGAYDTHSSYQTIIHAGAVPCFPPRKNAIQNKPSDDAWRIRNNTISQVNCKGLKIWKKENNYHRRSLAETAMFRFKQLFDDKIMAKNFERQFTEVAIKCFAINKFNQLGMPVY